MNPDIKNSIRNAINDYMKPWAVKSAFPLLGPSTPKTPISVGLDLILPSYGKIADMVKAARQGFKTCQRSAGAEIDRQQESARIAMGVKTKQGNHRGAGLIRTRYQQLQRLKGRETAIPRPVFVFPEGEMEDFSPDGRSTRHGKLSVYLQIGLGWEIMQVSCFVLPEESILFPCTAFEVRDGVDAPLNKSSGVDQPSPQADFDPTGRPVEVLIFQTIKAPAILPDTIRWTACVDKKTSRLEIPNDRFPNQNGVSGADGKLSPVRKFQKAFEGIIDLYFQELTFEIPQQAEFDSASLIQEAVRYFREPTLADIRAAICQDCFRMAQRLSQDVSQLLEKDIQMSFCNLETGNWGPLEKLRPGKRADNLAEGTSLPFIIEGILSSTAFVLRAYPAILDPETNKDLVTFPNSKVVNEGYSAIYVDGERRTTSYLTTSEYSTGLLITLPLECYETEVFPTEFIENETTVRKSVQINLTEKGIGKAVIRKTVSDLLEKVVVDLISPALRINKINTVAQAKREIEKLAFEYGKLKQEVLTKLQISEEVFKQHQALKERTDRQFQEIMKQIDEKSSLLQAIGGSGALQN